MNSSIRSPHGKTYTFDHFRSAMLSSARNKPMLADWRARGEDDAGLMLTEMWACVCDVVSFYNERIADESYLRTAVLKLSLRKLAGMVGYLPKPSGAAFTKLLMELTGDGDIMLPVGTQFRSKGFDDEKAQIFETTQAACIRTGKRSWELIPSRPFHFEKGSRNTFTVDKKTSSLQKDNLIAFTASQNQPDIRRIINIKPESDILKTPLLSIELDQEVSVPYDYFNTFIHIHKLTPLQAPVEHDNIDGHLNTMDLRFNSLPVELNKGDKLLLETDSFPSLRVLGTVTGTDIFMQGREAEVTFSANSQTSTAKVSMPVQQYAVYLQFAPKQLSASFALKNVFLAEKAADVLPPIPESAEAYSFWVTPDQTDLPPDKTMIFTDGDGKSFEGIPYSFFGLASVVAPKTGNASLKTPLKLQSDWIEVSRGETVKDEILGSGDVLLSNQVFTLKKGPLTYRNDSTSVHEHGMRADLEIRVDNILWTEVAHFCGVGPEERVYIVRHNDKDEADITFGDGVNGSRLPTGTDNIRATYRFGSGEAAPPAGGITKAAGKLKNLSGIFNPFPACGGNNAESEEEIRTRAPSVPLLKQRIVSLRDAETLASNSFEIKAARAEWFTPPEQQHPALTVRYIGDDSLKIPLTEKLKDAAAPGIPIYVQPAEAVDVILEIKVELNERYLLQTVAAAIREVLLKTQNGFLTAELLGIEPVIYRSKLLGVVTAVEGVENVTELIWNSTPFYSTCHVAGRGKWFRFSEQNLTITKTTGT